MSKKLKKNFLMIIIYDLAAIINKTRLSKNESLPLWIRLSHMIWKMEQKYSIWGFPFPIDHYEPIFTPLKLSLRPYKDLIIAFRSLNNAFQGIFMGKLKLLPHN